MRSAYVLMLLLLQSFSPVFGAIDIGSYPLNFEKEGLRLPRIADNRMRSILSSKNTIFYRLPAVYQQFNPATVIEQLYKGYDKKITTAVKMQWGLFFATFLPDFNGNEAFPWETTLGYNMAMKEKLVEKRYGAIDFVYLPPVEGSLSEILPIAVLHETPIKWIYPPGTIAGEVLWIKDDAGEKHVFEIRAREKHATNLVWEPMIYRPIRDRAELLREINYPADWVPPKRYIFLRNVHEDEVFKMEGFVERIPDLDSATVKRLLEKPFQEVTYTFWGDSYTSTTPASDIEFNIFPKDYNLGLIVPDEQTCAGCHRQTSISLRELIPKEPLIYNNPSKVANIRGSDGIFTYYPFSADSISDGKAANGNVKLRQLDWELGRLVVVKPGEKFKHQDRYKLTEYVQRALPKHDFPVDARFLHSGVN